MMKYSDLRESTSKQYIAFRLSVDVFGFTEARTENGTTTANNVNNISPEACAPSWEFLLVTNDPATCSNETGLERT